MDTSNAQNTIPQPKPLPCRLAALLADWRQSRDNMKKLGQHDAADTLEICAEMLHGEVSAFFAEVKAWREATANQQKK
jgi:hypothetical protein